MFFEKLKEFWQAPRETARLRKKLAHTRRQLRKHKQRAERLESGLPPFPPERLVWILGTARSGTTWLWRMMAEMQGWEGWSEPKVGQLFGQLSAFRRSRGRAARSTILSERYKETWLPTLRSLVLEGVRARFPGAASGYIVVKEPGGAVGAPFLSEALPESPMVFVVRDPRDVAASAADGHAEGGWMRRKKQRRGVTFLGYEKGSVEYVSMKAEDWLRQIGNGKRAYDTHQGPKVLVRYEELHADTFGMMKRLYSTLGIEVDEGELARVVEKYSWENVPEEKKGEGKFHRKGTPGGWREDLTPEQVKVIEETTRPLLEEFYPG